MRLVRSAGAEDQAPECSTWNIATRALEFRPGT
jgi:hypothetical protein